MNPSVTELSSEPSHATGWPDHWFRELRYSWAALFILVLVPAITFGSPFAAASVLLAAILIALPVALIATFFSKNRSWRNQQWRRFTLFSCLPLLVCILSFQTDKFTPALAMPIAQAITQYQQATGNYPATLQELTPSYLTELPRVRLSLIQPRIFYQLHQGRPQLAIPSAQGDLYARFEYDFANARWLHHP